jgi:hypothetical protein
VGVGVGDGLGVGVGDGVGDGLGLGVGDGVGVGVGDGLGLGVGVGAARRNVIDTERVLSRFGFVSAMRTANVFDPPLGMLLNCFEVSRTVKLLVCPFDTR